MDKGFSSSRDPRKRSQAPPPAPPKTIGNGPSRPDDLAFNDSSRDPRLNHDKYQKIMNKPRISPDTTAVSSFFFCCSKIYLLLVLHIDIWKRKVDSKVFFLN